MDCSRAPRFRVEGLGDSTAVKKQLCFTKVPPCAGLMFRWGGLLGSDWYPSHHDQSASKMHCSRVTSSRELQLGIHKLIAVNTCPLKRVPATGNGGVYK